MTDFMRRIAGALLVAGVTSLLIGSTGCGLAGKGSEGEESWKHPRNEDFYTADGKFDQEAAKKAFYSMMEHYNYPIPDRLRGADFWVADFGLGKFAEVGMAGIFWVNNKPDDYFGHEIYLLPGQMIPEHRHVKTDDARPKMEAWQVRSGWVYLYGEGEPTPGAEARIPASHKECAKARVEKKVLPGEVGELRGPEEWHWMLAGPEGAIVTEYASFHDGKALRFSHPDIKF